MRLYPPAWIIERRALGSFTTKGCPIRAARASTRRSSWCTVSQACRLEIDWPFVSSLLPSPRREGTPRGPCVIAPATRRDEPTRRSIIAAAIFCIALAVGVSRSAPAQARHAPPQPLPEDSSIRIGRLRNGLTYYLKHDGYPAHRAELRLVVNAGSVLEDADQRGLAHLLEHMAFDGSTHFPKGGIWDYLERIGMRGGADINAATSYDQTVYRLTIPSDSGTIVGNALQILGDWAHGLTLDSTEFERERNVVIEEWRLHRGADARITDRQLPVLLAGSRYAGRQPIGLKRTLDHATLTAVRRFYHDWYRPDLEAVVIVGDVDPVALEIQVQRTLEVIPAPVHPRRRSTFAVPAQTAPQISIVTDSEATATSVTIVAERPHRAVRTVDDYRGSLVEDLLKAMLATRLREATRRPDAPFLTAGAGADELVRGVDIDRLSARVVDGGVRRGLEALLAEAARVRRDGFTATELERAQSELLRRYDALAAKEDKMPSAQVTQQLVGEYLTGEPTPALDDEVTLAHRLVPAITLADVRSAADEELGNSNRVLLVSGPASASGALPSTSELLTVLASPPPELAPYVDSMADAPLLAHEPTPGSVVAAARLDTIGVQIWTLRNGVRVILKPITVDPDEILVTSYRDGGTSIVPDSDVVPASTALAMVGGSGLGRFDADALHKRLAGAAVSVGSTIGPYGEGVWGRGSPKDMRTLFQLVHLEFVGARLDSAAVRQYQASLRDALAHRAASPEAAFDDTLALVLANHSPRVRLLNDAYLAQLNPAKSLAFVRSRFADAAGFTFVIVGAFDPDSIKPLVSRYLGGLPASGRGSAWRDIGVRPPAGIVTRVVRKGREQKGATTLLFLGRADTSRAERTILLALADVLQRRLRERLREQLGGVYGVSATGDQEMIPLPAYRLAVSFGADPARLDELTKAVFAEIARLKAEGPTPVELDKFKEEYRRGRETAIKTNVFWLQSIALYDQRGWPLTDLLTADRPVDSITASQLQAAAQYYLNPGHYVQVSLLPENSAPTAKIPGA
jgi:zinc protease